MKTLSMKQAKIWIKTSKSPWALIVYSVLTEIRLFDFPAPKALFLFIYRMHELAVNCVKTLLRVFYWTPLFKSQTVKTGKHLYLYGGLPYFSGALKIEVGDDCRISGQSTFSGRVYSQNDAQLTIGSNVDIGWMTTIACGSKVVIGDNVRIAGRAFLAGYPGHPVDATQRALGAPDLDSQVGDIILQNHVWLATGVSVMAGVTIGEGTIVAAGSVVTHDLPPYVLAAGVPARVIKPLK